MMASPLGKNPINVIMGMLISQLHPKASGRKSAKSQRQSEDFANILGISRSYLRAIEAGTRALPPYCALGLARAASADFGAVAVLLAVVDYLDKRPPGQATYDPSKIRQHAFALKRVVETSFHPLIDRVLAAIDRIDEISDSDAAQLLAVIRTPTKVLPGTSSPTPEAIARPSLLDGLSPVFADLVHTIVSRLALFPPHANRGSLILWERYNYDRIKTVLGYVTDSEVLRRSVREDEFDWGFLGNRNEPRVRLLIKEGMYVNVEELEAGFRQRLKQYLGNSPERVSIRMVDEETQKRCEDALWFDFATRQMASTQEPDDVRSRKRSVQQWRNFMNAWIYEIVCDTPDVALEKPPTNFVGYLDNYEVDSPNDPYAVVMDREHVKCWRDIFDDMNKPIQPRLTRKRVRTTAR